MSSIEIRRHPQQRGQTHQTDSTGAPVVQGEADNTRQPPPVADNTPAAPGQVYYSVSRTEPYEYVFRTSREQEGE